MSTLTDTARIIKATVPMPTVARMYGYEPNHAGMIICPFHADKTPSLKVYPQAGRGFYCFGCGAKSSVIDFVMMMERVDFSGAVRMLAGEIGLPVDDSRNATSETSLRIALELRKRMDGINALQREHDAIHAEYIRLTSILHEAAPSDPDDPTSSEWEYAIKNIARVEYEMQRAEDRLNEARNERPKLHKII